MSFIGLGVGFRLSQNHTGGRLAWMLLRLAELVLPDSHGGKSLACTRLTTSTPEAPEPKTARARLPELAVDLVKWQQWMVVALQA